MKRIFAVMSAVCLLLSACALGAGVNNETSSEENVTSETYVQEVTTEKKPNYTLPDETLSLSSGEYILFLTGSDSDGWSVSIADNTDIMFVSKKPARINTVIKKNADAKEYNALYSSVSAENGVLKCAASLTSDYGAVFDITDIYSSDGEGAFVMQRSVSVGDAGTKDMGYSSLYRLTNVSAGTKSDDFEYFIPSIIYRDTEYLSSGAIMASLSSSVNYVKETRTGTPLAMLRVKKTGSSVALLHIDPKITPSDNYFKQGTAISDDITYGSLGFSFISSTGVDFVYPSYEAPYSYENGSYTRRYNRVKEGSVQSYTLGIIPYTSDLYNDAMTETYLKAINMSELPVAETDLERAYDLNMELYDELFLKYKGSGNSFSAGYPFAVNVKDFDLFYAVSFQMGFIGAQTEIAAELIRDGIASSDSDRYQMGADIINFWISPAVFGKTLPSVWWSPSNGGNAGSDTGYPRFIRCLADGFEGILSAYKTASAAGYDVENWKAAVLRMADFLVDHQNSDGSYYRAYNANGSVCTDTSSAAYQGKSKVNTPVAVRFLCSVYELTGDEKYRAAAVAAADYCYNELYLGLGKYIGGTPDNPNVVDKEAAVYALYAFSSIYDLTKDDKYLPAMKHAAASAMSWVYTYDFAVPAALTDEYAALNIFADGATAGWSIIATGHSAIDVFGASAYYELFNMYVRTGNKAFFDVAGLLQNNTRSAMDLDGTKGYKYGGFCLEACNTADQIFYTAENGVWLPWISAVFMQPMNSMEDTYGCRDIYEASENNSPEKLLEMLYK